MNDDLVMKVMAHHVDAMHCMLDGAERVIDARAATAVYIARAGKMLATLRVRGLTTREEIEALAEQLTLDAMSDSSVVSAHDPLGRELLTPDNKAKAN